MGKENLLKIKLERFKTGRILARDVFVHLPVNQKMIRIVSMGDDFSADLLNRLIRKGIDSLFVTTKSGDPDDPEVVALYANSEGPEPAANPVPEPEAEMQSATEPQAVYESGMVLELRKSKNILEEIAPAPENKSTVEAIANPSPKTKALDKTTPAFSPEKEKEDETFQSFPGQSDGEGETVLNFDKSKDENDETVRTFSSSKEEKDETVRSFSPSREEKDETVRSFSPSREEKDETVRTFSSSKEEKDETVRTFSQKDEFQDKPRHTATSPLPNSKPKIEMEVNSNLEADDRNDESRENSSIEEREPVPPPSQEDLQRDLPAVVSRLASYLGHSLGYVNLEFLADLSLGVVLHFVRKSGTSIEESRLRPLAKEIERPTSGSSNQAIIDSLQITQFLDAYLDDPSFDLTSKDVSKKTFESTLKRMGEDTANINPWNLERWAQLASKGPSIEAHSLCSKASTRAVKESKGLTSESVGQ